MKTFILALGLVMALQACTKKHCLSGCIESKIEELKRDKSIPVGKVDEYLYKGQTVYVFEDDHNVIADGGARVVDANCQDICYLGGLASIVLCNGDKFYEVAVYKRTLFRR